MKISKRLFFPTMSVLLLVGHTASPAPAQETKTFVAYSMKVAQARVEAAIKTGEDFRKKQPDLFYLAGITKPWAVVIDVKGGDWILVGERDPKSSVLTLDDWVVALRARFIHAERDPGVTIDPRSCEDCLKAGKKEACYHCTKQDVRFFGGIENTHFGQVCFEADWLMKKIGLGIESPPVEKLKTYYDLSAEQHRSSRAGVSRVISRFWFYPILSRVNVVGDVVLLEKFQLGVFTEVLHAEVDGKPVKDIDRFEHYPSEGFSRSFSDNYDAVAHTRGILETLRGLTRLAALAKGLTQVQERPGLNFCLADYPMARSETPLEADVLRVGGKNTGFEIAGGVDLAALAARCRSGDASGLRDLVLRVRPTAESASWSFDVRPRDGRIVEVTMPAGDSSEQDHIGWLFAQALFLKGKRRYDLAIECYDCILRADPSLVAGYNDRGAAHADNGDYDRAVADYSRAIELDPSLAPAYMNRGNAHALKGDCGLALADFGKAIELRPSDALAHFNLGLALASGGEYGLAIKRFTEAIRLSPSWAAAFCSRGTAYQQQGATKLAVLDWLKAVELDPLDAEALNNLGLYYAGTGGSVEQGIRYLEKAIAISPEAQRLVNLGEVYRGASRPDKAIPFYTRALGLKPNYPPAISSMFAAHAEMENYSEATVWARKYLEVAPKGKDAGEVSRYLEWIGSHGK